MKRFADNNLNENGIKFSKKVENSVGKEKLLIMSNFSFPDRVFKRLILQTHINKDLFEKGLRHTRFGSDLTVDSVRSWSLQI